MTGEVLTTTSKYLERIGGGTDVDALFRCGHTEKRRSSGDEETAEIQRIAGKFDCTGCFIKSTIGMPWGATNG